MKKIMFNDRYGLTQAVIEGRKTQTRRNFTLTLHKKDGKGRDLIEVYPTKVYFEDGKWKFIYNDNVFLLPSQNYPKYKIGEVIAVAQSYKDLGHPEFSPDISPKDYKVTRGTLGKSKGWKNKMFVRAEACKYQIRITNVRIEHLQDISDEDCLKEGIIKKWHAPACKNYYYVPGIEVKSVEDVYDTAKEAFARLIDKVSGKGTWQNNPFVWVYDFELVK